MKCMICKNIVIPIYYEKKIQNKLSIQHNKSQKNIYCVFIRLNLTLLNPKNIYFVFKIE